jgi:hypothetical protein
MSPGRSGCPCGLSSVTVGERSVVTSRQAVIEPVLRVTRAGEAVTCGADQVRAPGVNLVPAEPAACRVPR